MKTDKPLIAGLLTLIPLPLIEIYTQIMKHFGWTNLSASESISLIWLKEPSIYLVLSVLVIFWTGIFVYYSARIWGVDYFPLKAMLITMTSESLMFNIFGVLAHNELLIQNVSGNYVHASAAATVGLTAGSLMKKYLFQSKKGISLKTDKPLLAILIGWSGWPIAEAVTRLAKHLGLTTLSTIEASSLMWVVKPSVVLGILSWLGLGAWVGLFTYYSVKLWGTDYFEIKAALIGLTCQSLLVQIFGVLGGYDLLVQNVGGTLVHALGATLGGLVVGFLMKQYLFKTDKKVNAGSNSP